MLKNYIKIAWRNILKTKGHSFINISGLAVGMAVAMLIGLWIYDELNFNKYHKSYSTIAQVYHRETLNGEKTSGNSMPRPLEFELRNKYGDNFRHIVMSRWDQDHILSLGENKIAEKGRYIQPAAPEMFSLRVLQGSANGLQDPYSIMISQSIAETLFGDQDPVDRILKLDNEIDVKITAVFEDLPHNSEFKNTKYLLPWDLAIIREPWIKEAKDNWGNHSFLIYVQINPNTSFEAVSNKIKKSMWENEAKSERRFHREVFLNPMSNWHLYSEWKNGVAVGGRIQFVWLFGIIGVFVLFLACINFMNLSTARSEKRAREVGVRKAIGSLKSQLVRQFLIESLLVVVLAFVIALILVFISLPIFNEIADKKMSMMWSSFYFWLISFAFILFTGLMAGSYPAFYLSSFNAVKVLKGTFQAGKYSSLPRKMLVVLQFTVSISLIIGTIIVYNQIDHAKNRPVGYDRRGLLTINVRSADLIDKYDVLTDELKKAGIATDMARGSSPLTAIFSNNSGLEWKGKTPDKVENFGTLFVTHDFGKTVGWEFVDGRDFSRSVSSDSIGRNGVRGIPYGIIFNEAAVKYMGLKNPVGEMLSWDGFSLRVIGVIKDMVMESPYQPVRQSVFIVYYDAASNFINIRLNPKLSAGEALLKMETIFKKVVPNVPFDYKFADTEYAAKFASEERIGKLSTIFATLAIAISCLGLFGLSSFVAEKRTKEIGIRKILGASLFGLWKMLSKEFVILVVLSSLVAIPIACYYLDQWLESYKYRVEISWWILALAIGGTLVITMITVSFQALKVGMSNPVNSLRSE